MEEITLKIGERCGSAPWDGAWLTPDEQAPSPCMLANQIWQFCDKGCICINRRELPKLGSAGAPPSCGRGVADPLGIQPSPACVILPNFVVLVKRYERY